MRLTAFEAMALAAADAGNRGERALVSRASPPQQWPAAVRDPLERAGTRLRHARADAMEMLAEAEQARASAERELTDDYLRRVGRSGDSGAGETAAEPVRHPPNPP